MQSTKKLLLAASVAACFASPTGANAAPGQVYVNLFEYKYNDIKEECTRALKPARYSAVQISVPSEAKGNTRNWWERYQPASYKLDGRLGTRAQLADMVATCRTAGIAIYADVVLNHMANGSGTGEAGSFYNNATNYPAIPYGSADFNTACNIDYNDPWSIQNCWLGDGKPDLPDLRTGTLHVRQKQADFLRDLLSLGVAGFRIDAAKHIPAGDLQAILQMAGNVNSATAAAFGMTKPWVTHEVAGGFGVIPESQRSVYFSTGTVNEFKYPTLMQQAFLRQNGNSISRLASILPIKSDSPNPWGFFASHNATVFVSNHDLERRSQSLTSRNGKSFNLANIFMLAYPYGQPQLQSGFKLNGDPHEDRTLVPSAPIYNNGVANFAEWDQQHRWREIANMVDFRNVTMGKWQVDNWITDGNDRISFNRGDRGFLAINRDDFSTWTRTFFTGMAQGRYCNVINGLLSADKKSCSGDVVTVNSDRTATLSIPSMSSTGIPAVAIHAEQMIDDFTRGDIDPPTVPTWLAPSNVTTDSITLRWNPSTDTGGSGLKGYKLVRDNGTPIPTTTNSFVDSGLLPGSTYRYTVSAHDHAGNNSASSVELSVTTVPIGCKVKVNFQVSDNTTVYGQDVYLTGSRAELGNWSTDTAAKLSGAAWPTWTVTRDLVAGATYEYKYLKKGVRPLQWETGANRVLTAPACGSAPVTVPLSNFRQ